MRLVAWALMLCSVMVAEEAFSHIAQAPATNAIITYHCNMTNDAQEDRDKCWNDEATKALSVLNRKAKRAKTLKPKADIDVSILDIKHSAELALDYFYKY